MNARNIIVVGASAGGISALKRVVRELPADLSASIFVAQHLSPTFPTALPAILQRAGKLKVRHPRNHEAIENGCIYVAPPDRHMLIQNGHVLTARGPRENHSRPAVDVLFRSAALVYGARVVGVILTGSLDDGTAGLMAIKDRGGIAVVQHPEEAEFPSMPASALQYVNVDHCLPLAEIPALLVSLASDPVNETSEHTMLSGIELENRIAMNDVDAIKDIDTLGEPSTFTCPDCHGAMWELRDHGFMRFRCGMGHAHTCESLLAQQSQAIDSLLEEARRVSHDQAALARYLGSPPSPTNDSSMRAWLTVRLKEAERKEALLEEALLPENEALASELVSVS